MIIFSYIQIVGKSHKIIDFFFYGILFYKWLVVNVLFMLYQ